MFHCCKKPEVDDCAQEEDQVPEDTPEKEPKPKGSLSAQQKTQAGKQTDKPSGGVFHCCHQPAVPEEPEEPEVSDRTQKKNQVPKKDAKLAVDLAQERIQGQNEMDGPFPELDEVAQMGNCSLSCNMLCVIPKIIPHNVEMPAPSCCSAMPSCCGGCDGVGTEGVERSLNFASTAGKILMTHQVTLQRLKSLPQVEKDAKVTHLNRWCAKQALDLVLDLKGYYIKAAQTLTGAGQLPPEMEDSFSVLLDQCPRQPFEVVKGIIEQELGCPMDSVFLEFGREAVAAASIGQVHFGRLIDGTKVAVKVQYPDVEKYFKMDLMMVSLAMKLAGMNDKVKEVFATMQKQFELEFNYTDEASIMREVASNILPLYNDRVAIPWPIDADHSACQRLPAKTLCTRKVLTMERLEGKPIREHTMQLMEVFAKMHGSTAAELKKQMNVKDVTKIDMENKAVKAAMNMGEVSTCQSNMLIVAVKVRNFAARLLGGCMSCCPHAQVPVSIQKDMESPLNGPRLARLLYDVHGHEIFQNGLFNSDPHAGNILMLPDGKLGLIDYGAVMKLTEEQRTNIANLFIAIADEDDEAAPQALWACGFRSAKQDSRLALLLAHVFFNRGPFPYDMNRLAPKVGMPLNADLITLDSYIRGGKLDDIVEFPGHLVMLQRCAMVLSGVAMELGAGRMSSAGMFKPQAVRWLERKQKEQRMKT